MNRLYLNGPLISAISATRNIKPLPIAWIAVASVLTGLLLLVLVLAFMWRMGYLGDRELRVTKVELRGKSYTIKQVKDATRNFSPTNKIGNGRFGMIYKAQLPNQTVAVKKLSFQSDIDQIGTEVYALKQLKHDNLVELLDVYSKKDLHLLIYEYMEKGSLTEVLFDESNFKETLDWPKRVNICLGIARGLKYLHQRSCKRVNMAPEYAMRKAITDKADIYSYEVLLLEIVSGKSNSKSEKNQGNDYLLNKACVLHSEKMLLNLVDTNLSGEYDKKQALKMLDLAIQCINLSPTLRPTMLEIVSELEQISNVNALPQLDF
ncbi:probable LRR receptor-like serine/threonine-protein kinase At1g53430 [Pistacia vera]|uniref:probable LRR receptor-like serine/threonine-protein kinase At1g53430 n=1 Tax=Pistacia vera TaxID=55513 RepID=UPI001262DB4B|nr:probable LRR receptor-like serine/threonine-protein kinase At1g53430 [Pistacia vera]